MRESSRRILVLTCALMMMVTASPAVFAGGGGGGHIWLNADPGERARGPGWQAGGWATYCDFGPDVVCEFELIVENKGKDDLSDLRLAMAIHNWTTSDDFVSIDIESETSYLPDFSDIEYNPFDDGWGGKHHVYVGTEAIWDIYFYEPEVLPKKSTVRLNVTVTLGPDPDDYFEIHFDAFDPVADYKSPDGHDLTFLSSARKPEEQKQPIAIIVPEHQVVDEGDLVTLDGSQSYDPDGTIVSYEWDLDIDVDSDGDGLYDNDVDATGPVVTFTWYDDYNVTVKLKVTDDDGLVDIDYGYVDVRNVPPSPSIEGAYVEVTLFLRVAGEKWHNVELHLYENYDKETGQGNLVAQIEVERWPGDPTQNPSVGDQGYSLRLSLDSSVNYTAVVTYDPYEDVNDAIMGDQPINGQLWGGNPVWIILDFAEGGQCKIHHTFNVQQSIQRDSEHFIHVEPWIVDINIGALSGAPLTFVGTATDPGSDDLTFTWDWGDGSNVTTTTYYYDPSRIPPDDPLPSPYEPYFGGTTPPLLVEDTQTHAYGAPGTYVVTLTVTDDDGDSTTVTTTITVGEGNMCPKGGGEGRSADQGELALLQITAWEYNINSGTIGQDDVVTFPDETQMTASEALDHLLSLYNDEEFQTAVGIAGYLNGEYGYSIGHWGLSPGNGRK
ncbi:MAG: PKD domain-containing protein [Thermoplasmata archaeon]